jgi:predicted nucleic acid-binding Zn ribbon protein
MQENRCIRCGRPIPEDMRICLACGDYDEMQTFRQHETDKQKKRYFRIVDECGWTHCISTDREDACAANIALLVPHVRSAAEITKEEFERSSE